MIEKIVPVLLSCVLCNNVSAALWQDTPSNDFQLRSVSALQAKQNQVFRFDEARLLNLDTLALNNYLDLVTAENTSATVIIPLPLPGGEFADYQIYHSPVMAPGLAAKYPGIRTFKVTAVDNPGNTGRIDLTPQGFHAILEHDQQTVFIDPIGSSNHYQSYFKGDYTLRRIQSGQHKAFSCNNKHHTHAGETRSLTDSLINREAQATAARVSFGSQIKTYRLAVALTGEFTGFHGGTVNSAMAALVTGVNRINQVYERDLAVRLEIVNDNDKVVYTNSRTDPFNNQLDLMSDAVRVINNAIGVANYDVGHVIGAVVNSGLARLGAICNDNAKALGETSNSQPVNDPFFIDFVAHELGHQFGAQHSFNGTTLSCSRSNRSEEHAYEPGSGSTIMAYAGICADENLQNNSDAYFHTDSIKQIRDHLDNGSGNRCGVFSGNNNRPIADAGTDKTIPIRTPFTLTGSGSDADGDTLSYTWEQLDLGAATSSQADFTDRGTGPLFRSFEPVNIPVRTFPQISDVLNNRTTYGEILPITDRDINFHLTVRDGKGGVASDEMRVKVAGNAGPFTVNLPANTTWNNSNQTITWNVAGTDSAPVNCATVNIDLALDGKNFTTSLLQSAPNTGRAQVSIPVGSSNNGRIRVSCTNQPFFAVNNGNIIIAVSSPPPTPTPAPAATPTPTPSATPTPTPTPSATPTPTPTPSATPTSETPNIVSINTGQSGSVITITSENGTRLTNVALLTQTEVNTTGKPDDYDILNSTIISYNVTNVPVGDTITVLVKFPEEIPANSKIFKITANGFTEFTTARTTGNTLTLILTDGGSGDADGVANGIIDDPVALLVPMTDNTGGGSGSTSESSSGGGGSHNPYLLFCLILLACRQLIKSPISGTGVPK